MARAYAYDPLELVDFVLGYDGAVIGAVRLSGLGAILDASQDKTGRTPVPRLGVAPADDEVQQWLRAWGSATLGGARGRRDLFIRDNRGDRWIHVKGTWIADLTAGRDAYPLSVDRADVVGRPSWWT
jgi:hypothetical protein